MEEHGEASERMGEVDKKSDWKGRRKKQSDRIGRMQKGASLRPQFLAMTV